MAAVMRNSWALFLGLLLLMAGNALQGAALGVRAGAEDISNEIYGYVSAAYFAGFLLGAHFTPKLLRRVGHIRVFAALGSLVSVAFILYAAVVDPVFWFVMRLLVGFGFSGVYIVAESWLNSVSSNETRGQVLSAYMFIQYFGVVLGQQMLNLGDPASYDLFVLMSVMVSLSFAPILLSVTPAPVYETAKPMSVRELFTASPLGSVGSALMGGVFGAMFGMGAVYGALLDFTVAEIALFLTMLYAGGTIAQVPVGWLSDRMDRRFLILLCAASSTLAGVAAMGFGDMAVGEIGGVRIHAVTILGFFYGALVHPIYGVLIAHTNDYLENDQMASAAGRFVFLNGFGALFGPIVCGYLMGETWPNGFWATQAACLGGIAGYTLFRMTQRASMSVDETQPYTAIPRTFTPVAAEMTQEVYIERAEAAAEEAAEDEDGDEKDDDAPVRRRFSEREMDTDEEEDERASREAVDND